MTQPNNEPELQRIAEPARREFLAGTCLTLLAGAGVLESGVLESGVAMAAEPASGVSHPVRLPKEHMEGKGLETLTPWPRDMLVKPLVSHRVIQWYTGEKLSCMVYDADDGVIKFTDLPYDEDRVPTRGVAYRCDCDFRRQFEPVMCRVQPTARR